MTRLASILGRLPEKTRSTLETIVVGVIASLAAVGFQLSISYLYRRFFEVPAAKSSSALAVGSLVVICLGALLSAYLLRKSPESAGSGIPQLKLAYWKDFGYTSPQIAPVKFLAGAIAIGCGLSLGREGPSVQLGGNLGSTVAGWMGASKQRRRSAAAAGAAAGLAAAFNAPLAAVAFVLEEMLEDLNSAFLGSALLASLIGAFIVHALIGAQPAFELPRITEPSWRAYCLIPFVGAFAALAGIAFQRGTMWLRSQSKALVRVPKEVQLLVAAVITWGIAMLIYSRTGRLGVFSLGYDDLSAALRADMAWKVALVLLAGKMIATISGYGTGGCGGIFSPSLFFGGMVGVVIAGIGSSFFALTSADKIMLSVGGMSACLGAVVQAPITALLIIFEMTHQFALIPGLMIAGITSVLVTRLFHQPNFYEEILLQDGHRKEHLVPPRDLRSWQGLPVSAIANFNPAVLRTVERTAIEKLLAEAPFNRFPVMDGSRCIGVVRREQLAAAIDSDQLPSMAPAETTGPQTTIREAQHLLIRSGHGMLVITEDNGRPLGVVTLHDLLRAQSAIVERHE